MEKRRVLKNIWTSLPISKSIAARKLILSAMDGEPSFQELKLEFKKEASLAQDTRDLIEVLTNFFKGKKTFSIGEGGSTLRFFSLFLSRQRGSFILDLGEGLVQRPHNELRHTLQQLGVQLEKSPGGFRMDSQGWPSSGLQLSLSMMQSSQHLSGFFLAAKNYPGEIQVQLPPSETWVSEKYLNLTLQCCGIPASLFSESFTFSPKNFYLHEVMKKVTLEKDLSSAFILASLEYIKTGTFKAPEGWEKHSQPDKFFLDIFAELSSTESSVQHAWDLRNTPDLAPVLSVLVALLGKKAQLRSLSHLSFKESQRDRKISELLELMKIKHSWEGGTLTLSGEASPQSAPETSTKTPELVFDPNEDHRMVMAAALAQQGGHAIKILSRKCVEKSFPLFWKAWEESLAELVLKKESEETPP
jgi:3-phosphoshikimate 1-carboxyvinyltransferase